MTRYINITAVKKMIAEKNPRQLGQSLNGVKAVASVKGKEQVGTVVYRRKVKYGAPFENRK